MGEDKGEPSPLFPLSQPPLAGQEKAASFNVCLMRPPFRRSLPPSPQRACSSRSGSRTTAAKQ